MRESPTPKVASEVITVRSAIRGLEQLLDTAAAWRSLCDEVASEPFCRPEWTEAYLRVFAPQAQVVLISAWSGARLLAILPLILDRGFLCGLPVKRLRCPASVHNCRFDLVRCPAEEGDRALRAIWDRLKEMGEWNVIDFRYVPEGGGIDQLLALAQADGFPTGKMPDWYSLYIPVERSAAPTPSWLARVHPKFRANLRRTRRQIEELGQLSLRHVTQADPEMLSRFYDLERSGWKGREGTAIACDQRTRQFYDDIVQSAARYGYLSLDFLDLGGQPISAHLSLLGAGRYCLAKAAYDEKFRRYGPGQLLVYEILQRSSEYGLLNFDFTGPAAWDESRWTSKLRGHFRGFIFRPNWSGRMLHALRITSRPALKKLLHLRPVSPPDFSSAGKDGSERER
jgi:CelD/BcsL family acetyltransferase involved in cellulose biosynthesis